MEKVKDKIKKLFKSLGKLMIGGAIILLFFLVIFLILNITLGIEFSDFQDQSKLQYLIEKSGGFGYLLFILISFLQVTFLPIPGILIILAGDYIFGFFNTLWMSSIGIITGSMVSFVIGRKVGRPFVNWVIGDKVTVDKYLKKVEGKETLLFFLMFLFPFFPDDPLCSVAGISNIKLKTFFIIQIITRPISIIGSLIFATGKIIPFKGWGILVLILLFLIMILISLMIINNADKINDFFKKLYKRLIKILHR